MTRRAPSLPGGKRRSNPEFTAENHWQRTREGLAVAVRLTPKGGRDALEGVVQLADGRCVLQARVRAAPHEGEANAALIKLIAKTLGVPPRDIQLVGGATARLKRLLIAGPTDVLATNLEKICSVR
jgi:uncharacterized protein (TIGR00251 family)